jgi:hypothetical protein
MTKRLKWPPCWQKLMPRPGTRRLQKQQQKYRRPHLTHLPQTDSTQTAPPGAVFFYYFRYDTRNMPSRYVRMCLMGLY